MASATVEFFTPYQMARRRGLSLNRVLWLLRGRTDIKPVGVANGRQLYDEAAVEEVATVLRRIDEARALMKPPAERVAG